MEDVPIEILPQYVEVMTVQFSQMKMKKDDNSQYLQLMQLLYGIFHVKN